MGIYTNTNADAQKFKFVETDNGYVIVTKSTGDQSAVVISESDTTGRTNGGNAHQSARTGSTSQVWVLEPVEELVITGDLNGDERVDSFDIILLRRCISGLLEQSSAADYNSDGVYNVSDLVGLESFLIGKKGFEPKVYGTPKNTIFPYDREPQP
ncbi:MAG: hypothetical protein IJ874_08015 [Ruminococcus sp.]|nr:hypothetical protein [Ruminococcus sp.]